MYLVKYNAKISKINAIPEEAIPPQLTSARNPITMMIKLITIKQADKYRFMMNTPIIKNKLTLVISYLSLFFRTLSLFFNNIVIPVILIIGCSKIF